MLTIAQNPVEKNQKSDFWQNVQFGGGFGLNLGNGFTEISLAPGAIYNFNKYVALGAGLQGSYISSRNFYSSIIYGGSIIALLNPINEIQLSAEIEQLRINSTSKNIGFPNFKENFWNTALYFGAGYRTGNVTVGARYNVLFKEDDFVYNSAFMPFVRIYF